MAIGASVAPCPDCGREIQLWPLLKVGEELICPHCEAELEVISLDPVELDWAYLPPAEDDEDWDDWDDEDEDED
jgi:alpha-aminoadipate carrier protein LysW